MRCATWQGHRVHSDGVGRLSMAMAQLSVAEPRHSEARRRRGSERDRVAAARARVPPRGQRRGSRRDGDDAIGKAKAQRSVAPFATATRSSAAAKRHYGRRRLCAGGDALLRLGVAQVSVARRWHSAPSHCCGKAARSKGAALKSAATAMHREAAQRQSQVAQGRSCDPRRHGTGQRRNGTEEQSRA